MGASHSSNSVNVVNTAIISVLTENVNNCTSATTQSQQVSFSGFGFLSSVLQSAEVNVKCLQNVTMNNDLSNKIAQQIQQQAAAAGIALLPNYSGTNNNVNISNYISTKLTTEILQSCSAGAIQGQQISFSGIQIGSSAKQILSNFTSCLQTALNNNQIAQGLVQDANQVATAKNTNPLDFLGNLFSSIAFEILMVIILIIVIGYFLFGSWGKKSVSEERYETRGFESEHHQQYISPVSQGYAPPMQHYVPPIQGYEQPMQQYAPSAPPMQQYEQYEQPVQGYKGNYEPTYEINEKKDIVDDSNYEFVGSTIETIRGGRFLGGRARNNLRKNKFNEIQL